VRRATSALAALALLGCGRGEPAPRPAPAEPPAPAAAPACDLAALPDRLPAAARVVAIGDLHGDLAAARAALRLAGVVDDGDRWVGGATVVVQTGDVLDRGDDEPEILDLIARLEREAGAAGGAFVALDGNHELMNAAGDLRYVTEEGLADFAGVPGGRAAAFAPGGPRARELAARRVVVVVGDTVFAHAGPSAGLDLAAANRGSRCWLAGQGPPPEVLEDQEGPLWTRAYGVDPPDCDRLAAALASLGVARMVVGHTVQPGGITSACDGRLWRIDVGLARHYGGPTEVLELRGTTATVLGR
jgi:hypothetical protein